MSDGPIDTRLKTLDDPTSAGASPGLAGEIKAWADAVKATVGAIKAVQDLLDSPRTITIEMDNISHSTLLKTADEHSHGGFKKDPAFEIAPFNFDLDHPNNSATDVFGSQSSGFLTGTEGSVTYACHGGAGDGLGVAIGWDNPFAGSNSCSVNMTGPHQKRFLLLMECGSGNNAQMRYALVEVPGPYSLRRLLIANGFNPNEGVRSHRTDPHITSVSALLGL